MNINDDDNALVRGNVQVTIIPNRYLLRSLPASDDYFSGQLLLCRSVNDNSNKGVQITRARIGGSLGSVDLVIIDEIPSMSSPTGIEMPPPIGTGVRLSSVSQSSSGLMNYSAIKKEMENSLGTEEDAAPTLTYISDNELREQNKQDPEKSVSCHVVGGATLISEAIINGNGHIDRIIEECSSDEPVNVLPKQVQAKRKKLLVLDINGLLADIVSPIPKDYKSDTNIARRAIFKRPFCSEFLTFCFETFEVGIWSSRTQKNVEIVIDFLLGDLKDRLLFCWDVTQCTATGFCCLENRHKTLMFKEIRKLWEPQGHGLPWETGHFDQSNTLLVDDSPYKALLNHSFIADRLKLFLQQHTAIFPQSYSYQDRHDTSLGIGGSIRAYLEALAASDNVQEYVEQHPFGQGFISQSSPSWDYYYKAVISLFTLLMPEA